MSSILPSYCTIVHCREIESFNFITREWTVEDAVMPETYLVDLVPATDLGNGKVLLVQGREDNLAMNWDTYLFDINAGTFDRVTGPHMPCNGYAAVSCQKEPNRNVVVCAGGKNNLYETDR